VIRQLKAQVEDQQGQLARLQSANQFENSASGINLRTQNSEDLSKAE
jgi:hypothetical protein